MMNVADYIKCVLKKKKWTNVQLCENLNKLEKELGDSRTTPQNITNYLNGYHDIRPKWLVKVEKALYLEQGTLLSMVAMPLSKEEKKELQQIMKRVNEIKL